MKRSKSGFSMTELLTVVAILAVLIAVAVPAVIAASKTLKMRELDDTAREIFLAAQNTLTARKAEGALSSPAGDAVEGEATQRWLFNADTEFLLPMGAVEPSVAENYIAVRYDAGSAVVLEVYYGERQGSFGSPACGGWAEETIKNGTYAGASARENRRSARIGYFSGANDLDWDTVKQLLPPTIRIENGEELKAVIAVPKAGEYITWGVGLTVVVEELDGGVPTGKTAEFTGLTYLSGTCELVLDSLRDGTKQFKNRCPDIAPGADIRVTAKLSALPGADGTLYLASKASAQTNSLFAERTADGTVSVACPRHLQNLEDDFSGFTAGGAVRAVQTDRIDWPAGVDFRSIGNELVAAYDGGGAEIRDLNAGLFDSTAANMRMDHIRIVDPIISGSGNIGALVNTAHKAQINDCRVYATTIDPGSGGTQTEDFDALKANFAVTGGTAGGLAGSAADCTITNSFAALSSVSGSTAGGLIGSASGCTITDCYATAENLSGSAMSAMFIGNMSGVTVIRCYAAGNIASVGGTVSGFANGTGAFSQSYCAVSYYNGDGTPTGVVPAYGFASGTGTSTCAYLTVNKPAAADGSAPRDFETLKTWITGWQSLTEAQTHPYRQELDGKAYPFPGLELPHYGSWPVQTVKGIKLYDAAKNGIEIHMILVPLGSETTVWAEVDGGVGVNVKAPQTGKILRNQDISSVPGEAGERTKITIGTKNNQKGVTYIDLEAGGYTLRVVVVVYQAKITLDGVNQINNVKAQSTADSSGTKTTGQLQLLSNARIGEFTASISVVPTKTVLDKDYGTNVLAKLPAGAEVSAELSDFADWDKLLDGDPAVTANGDLETGTWVLTLNGEGKNLYGSKEDSDGNNAKLTVTGAATGTAKVSARWAMDPKLEAVCDVQMKGARALISEAAATTSLDGKVKKTGYPYRLDLTAEPKEDITLTFTPRLFNAPMGGTQQYTWKVQRIEDGRWLEENGDSKPTENDGIWTYTLKDHEPRATYRVTLEYTSDSGEKSVDYMTFSVYRKASKTETDYSYIVIKDRDTGVSVTTTSAGTVEQVTAVGYETANQIELEGYVSGAANTRVKWWVDAVCGDEGETWTPVTGSGSQTVRDSGGIERFKVEWLSGEFTTTVDGVSVPTGGAIRITGLDSNEYDVKHTVKLKAEAMESGGTGTFASSRTVSVDVMPKLQITPQTYVGYSGRQVTLTANRTDSGERGWGYKWTIDETAGTTFADSGSSTLSFQMNAEGERRVTLSFGPHTSSAIVQAVNGNWKALTTINWDAQVTENSTTTDYFLVQKGHSKDLGFSWFVGSYLGRVKVKATSHVTGSVGNGIATVTYDAANSSPALNTYSGNGNLRYSVTGNDFGTADLNWDYSVLFVLFPSSERYPAKLAVVGMDIRDTDENGEVVNALTLNQLERSKTLFAHGYFPQELIEEESITWTLDDRGKEIIQLVPNGDTAVVTAKKFGAVTYSATVGCTYTVKCINGQTYTFKDYATVKVEPQGAMTVTLEPCIGDDAEALNDAFGLTGSDRLTAESCMAAVNENGVLTLLRDEAYGYDTMYLKATATLDGAAIQDLTEYISNVYGDEYYLKLDVPSSAFYAENADCRDTLYIRVKAEAANATPTDVELTAELGTDSDQKTIRIYDIPQIRLRHGSDDVTNGSLPVYLNDANTKLPVLLTAEIEPKLYSAADTEKVSPLLQNGWELEAPVGYSAEEYLTLTVSADGAAQVALKDLARLPDFRVVLHASCENSSAGYAVVFVPEDDTGSGSMTRRKRYNVLGA